MKRSTLESYKKKFYKDYYHKSISAREIAQKYGFKKSTVNYHLTKVKMTQLEYLEKIYSNEDLELLISQHTYKEVAKILKIPFGRLRILLSNKNIFRSKEDLIVNSISNDFFAKPSNAFWYYIGLVASDGYIKNKSRVRIVIKNKGALALFERLAVLSEFQGKIFTLKNGFYEITFTNKNLIDRLNKVGIPTLFKTKDLKCPKFSNKQYLICYFLGLFDGDGSINKKQMSVKIVNYSDKFIVDLESQLYRFFNVKGEISKGESVTTLRYKSKETKLIMSYAYKTAPLYLECKYSIYADKIRNSTK